MANVTVLYDNVVEVQYTEPTTTIRVSDGALIPLDDLVATRIYYQIQGQSPVLALVVPATASTGGGSIARQLTIPVVGTQSVDVWFTAIDEVPNESPPSPTFTVTLQEPVGPMPLTVDALTANLVPPQVVGTPITFTAIVSGGSGNYETEWVAGVPRNPWEYQRWWQPGLSFTWIPLVANANYTMYVHAREVGTAWGGQENNLPFPIVEVSFPTAPEQMVLMSATWTP